LFALVLTVLTAKEMPPQGNCQVWSYFFCPQKKKLTVEIFRSRKIQPLARFTITQGGVFRPQTVSTLRTIKLFNSYEKKNNLTKILSRIEQEILSQTRK